MVARITRARGPGPLLELPIVPPIADKKVLGTEVVSMLGSTRHWLPLVAGFTGYQPPHRSFVMRAIDELPSRRALQRLIDMTHVRWILLQPPDRWPQSRIAQRDKLLRSPLLRQIAAKGGWVLLRVKPSTRDLGWYEAIAAGPHPERTILGTSLAPIPEKDAAAVVHARARSPIEAGKLTLVRFWVRNVGAATWPMSAMTEEDECARCVRVVAAWRPVGRAAGKPVKRQYAPLPIDMLPGEELTFARWLEAPDDPGTYRLQVRVEQTEGAQFSGRGNVDADVRVKVVPAQDGPVKEPADKAA
jgi:hypothetical protein